jgi:hypothetical protein
MNSLMLLAAATAAAVSPAPAAEGPRVLNFGQVSTGQPTSFDLATKPAAVVGYRSARFGMTKDQVIAAAARDFPARTKVEESDSPDRTHLVSITVPSAAPGPGPATINYVFGATTKRLIAVNVIWLVEGEPAPAVRAQMIAAGSELTADLLGYFWKPLTVARGVPAGPIAVILFAGADDKDAGVEVRLDGIQYDFTINGQPARSQEPTGPVRLRLSYVANRTNPDIYRIKPGEF